VIDWVLFAWHGYLVLGVIFNICPLFCCSSDGNFGFVLLLPSLFELRLVVR